MICLIKNFKKFIQLKEIYYMFANVITNVNTNVITKLKEIQ